MIDDKMRESSKLFSFVADIDSPREIFLDGEHKMIALTEDDSFVISRNGDQIDLSYWDLITKYKINRNENTNQLYLLGRTKYESQKEKIKLKNFIKIMQEDSRNGILDTLQLANSLVLGSHLACHEAVENLKNLNVNHPYFQFWVQRIVQ